MSKEICSYIHRNLLIRHHKKLPKFMAKLIEWIIEFEDVVEKIYTNGVFSAEIYDSDHISVTYIDEDGNVFSNIRVDPDKDDPKEVIKEIIGMGLK